MDSFGYGKYSFQADSIEEGLAIAKCLEKLDHKKTLREHEFNSRTDKCIHCGIYRIDCLDNKEIICKERK